MVDENLHLALAERHIHEGIRRIRAQQARVRSGKGNMALGLNLLNAMYETLHAGLEHRRMIRRELLRNRLPAHAERLAPPV